MTDLLLRRFEPSDASALTRMLHRAYRELGAAGLNFTAVDQDESVTLERASAGPTWLLLNGGEIVAAITMSSPPGPGIQALSVEARSPGRVWLNQLAVDPGARGTGAASRLWAVAREWAASVQATHIGLDTAGPATHLIALYQRWGFLERERVQWADKTYESVIMARPL